MSEEIDESKLIKRLKKRDERAFATMVQLYQNRVFGLVFRMLGDRAEAEDLAQEVFVTVFKSIDSFRGDSKFSTWLYRIATNHCKNRIKYLQRRHHKRTKDIDDTNETEFTSPLTPRSTRPDEMAGARQLEKIIQQSLAELDEEHRVVIILRDIDHLSYTEIAEITGVAEGTVKSRIFRGRASLRALVEEKSNR
ncbi:MAG: RNA polymerase sigma-70 factor (ECF subfamily) [Bradymonadia bacterium]|jgi:RNA polymerase sigma-70 factor (ECF subfamily)